MTQQRETGTGQRASEGAQRRWKTATAYETRQEEVMADNSVEKFEVQRSGQRPYCMPSLDFPRIIAR